MRGLVKGVLVVSLMFSAARVEAQVQPAPLPLWQGGAPGALGTSPEDTPTLTPYLPSGTATGTGVVVFPGGGYGHLAMDHEGKQVAEWLNSLGVAAFVVQYRLGPKYQHPAMMYDAQRAVRTVRARASEWGVDPGRIGVLGFSAGGHLASTAGTHFGVGDPAASDPVERVGSRPDFMILVYPVITMRNDFTHQGSRRNLLGERPEAGMVWLMSNETQVTPETPPTFLVHTTDDSAVPVENSLQFYRALRNAGVPVEMHIYESGPHGFGLGGDRPVLSTWPDRARAWMEAHGWVGSR
jgi:acetyl esterase/lipase